MIQVAILIGILSVLCIQLGIINIRPIMRLFRRGGISNDYYNDDRAYASREKYRHVSRSKKSRRPPPPQYEDDISVTSDDSIRSDDSVFDHVNQNTNPSQNMSSHMTPLKKLIPANTVPGNIRGADILQRSDVPWQGPNMSSTSDPEVIQRQIMEELGSSRYGGNPSSQLSPVTM